MVSVCIRLVFVLFFFFQAEDGIRDAQESRGLGDVYKRQMRLGRLDQRRHARAHEAVLIVPGGVWHGLQERVDDRGHPQAPAPVSYTHLTLPTIYSV